MEQGIVNRDFMRRCNDDGLNSQLQKSRAGRNERSDQIQSQARDIGGGKFVLIKDVSSPILIHGRHWGAFRMGFRPSQDAIAETQFLDQSPIAAVLDKKSPLFS